VFAQFAAELQSAALPLLLRTPNAKHAAGLGRDRWLLNPGATAPAQLDMFVFLGKLMGYAMRSKVRQFSCSSIVQCDDAFVLCALTTVLCKCSQQCHGVLCSHKPAVLVR
jgi:hypothetical protein